MSMDGHTVPSVTMAVRMAVPSSSTPYMLVGPNVGTPVGTNVGTLVGTPVGRSVGVLVGTSVGSAVGVIVGAKEGTSVVVGESEVGGYVGLRLGAGVGTFFCCWQYLRSMSTVKADDLCRFEDTRRRVSPRPFRCHPPI